MESEIKQRTVEIRVFGRLRRYLDENGLPYTLERQVEENGSSAYELAGELGLPAEEVEAVFRNGSVQNIYDPVRPGDRIAFLPYGTPGPYRAFLGIWKEGRKSREIEESERRDRSSHGQEQDHRGGKEH
jgi:hypothetical protein